MNDREHGTDPYEKKLAEIIEEDRKRQAKDRKRMKKLKISLGCTFVIMAGLVAGGGLAGRQLMKEYGVGMYAEKAEKEAEPQQKSAESSGDIEDPEDAKDRGTKDSESERAKPPEQETTESEKEDVEEEKEKDTDKDREKKKAVAPISYDKKKRSLSFSVNGSEFTFPVKSKDFQECDWDMADQSEDMHNTSLLIDTLYDAHGSSIYLYHKKPEKNSQKEADMDTSSSRYELVFASKETEMMGLNMQCQMEKVEQIMESADKVDDRAFDSRSQNGEVVYSYGDYGVTVTFANKYVSAIQIMHMEKEVKKK